MLLDLPNHRRTPHGDLCLIHKVASTAFRERFTEMVYEGDIVNGIVFIRDPVDRLVSCYQHQHADDKTYEEFVDIVLSGQGDSHWLPQSVFMSKDAEYTVLQYEDIDLYYSQLEHVNASEKLEVNREYRLEELKDYYKDDYELRSRISS